MVYPPDGNAPPAILEPFETYELMHTLWHAEVDTSAGDCPITVTSTSMDRYDVGNITWHPNPASRLYGISQPGGVVLLMDAKRHCTLSRWTWHHLRAQRLWSWGRRSPPRPPGPLCICSGPQMGPCCWLPHLSPRTTTRKLMQWSCGLKAHPSGRPANGL